MGMFSLSALSRRAFVVATALVAVAPHAAIAKKKSPRAFVAARVADIGVLPEAAVFAWAVEGQLVYPDSASADDVAVSFGIEANTTAGQVRARIVSGLKNRAADILASQGLTVSADHIAVILL